ncbi:hypothetical protein [Flavobacterium sp.]|uniref:hypothetical protein n=1 Tax=Flavobacterium sp. TaxID=239 RepID=UPI00286E48BA|nr:hypothetical protein [Flavobacterium sp.]
MKKFLVFIFFNLLFLSCKENYNSEVQNNTSKVKDSIAQKSIENKVIINEGIQNSENNVDCNNILLDFIKSSSLTNPFKENLTGEIEDITNFSIKIMLYDGSNVVGTLLFDAQNSTLLDLTNDIENPEKLKFDVKKWNIIIDCYFKKNKEYYIDHTNDFDCKTNQIEMGLEEICTIKNSTVNDVYLELIKNRVVDKSEKLKKILPQKSETIKLNSDGLISIDYIINKKQVQVEMLFDGGVTTVLLEQIGNNVNRIITTSAD